MITTKLCAAGGLQRVKTPQQAVNFWATGETPWEARFKRLQGLFEPAICLCKKLGCSFQAVWRSWPLVICSNPPQCSKIPNQVDILILDLCFFVFFEIKSPQYPRTSFILGYLTDVDFSFGRSAPISANEESFDLCIAYE